MEAIPPSSSPSLPAYPRKTSQSLLACTRKTSVLSLFAHPRRKFAFSPSSLSVSPHPRRIFAAPPLNSISSGKLTFSNGLAQSSVSSACHGNPELKQRGRRVWSLGTGNSDPKTDGDSVRAREADSSNSDILVLGLLFGVWYFFCFYHEQVLEALHYPVTVSLGHIAVGTMVAISMWTLHILRHTKFSVSQLFGILSPTVLAHMLGNLFTNMIIGRAPVSYAQTLSNRWGSIISLSPSASIYIINGLGSFFSVGLSAMFLPELQAKSPYYRVMMGLFKASFLPSCLLLLSRTHKGSTRKNIQIQIVLPKTRATLYMAFRALYQAPATPYIAFGAACVCLVFYFLRRRDATKTAAPVAHKETNFYGNCEGDVYVFNLGPESSPPLPGSTVF